MSKFKHKPIVPAPTPVVEEPKEIEEAISDPAPNEMPTFTLVEPSNVVELVNEEVKAPVPLMASVGDKAPTYRYVDGDKNVQTLTRDLAIKLLADRLKINGGVAADMLDGLAEYEVAKLYVPSANAGSGHGTLMRYS